MHIVVNFNALWIYIRRHISSPKQNEGELMSILRDLEPQNAKIHYASRVARKGNQIALALAVLLLLGGMIGLFRSTQSQPIQTAVDHSATPPGIDAGPARDSPTSTPTLGAGSALIRENRLAQNNRASNKAHDENILPAMQVESRKTQAEQRLASKTSPQSSKPNLAATEQHRKAMNNADVRKLPKNTARHSTSNGRHVAESYKKPMERDIDIITAIVK